MVLSINNNNYQISQIISNDNDDRLFLIAIYILPLSKTSKTLFRSLTEGGEGGGSHRQKGLDRFYLTKNFSFSKTIVFRFLKMVVFKNDRFENYPIVNGR